MTLPPAARAALLILFGDIVDELDDNIAAETDELQLPKLKHRRQVFNRSIEELEGR